MKDFERVLGGRVRLEHPIMNGPGWACKSIEDARTLVASASAGVMVGSITKEAREGNPGGTSFFDIPHVSSNSLGMPNRGLAYYKDEKALDRMVEIAHGAGKPIFVSVAGFSEEEFTELAVAVEGSGADGVQLNLSCPNVKGKGVVCYDFDATDGIIRKVIAEVDILVDAKLAPFSNPADREEMARLIKETGVPVVTLCNAFPGVLLYDDNLKPAVYSKASAGRITTGSMGGLSMKPITLAHVATFRSILHPWQDIIGIGGVESGRDVLEYETAGAPIVQLTTAHAKRGTKVFDQILAQYAAIRSMRGSS